ncbi:sel1 repeat family protein [Francisella tularensis]|uniref:Sel1 repeat family protein n=8 Tax=Francisella tularensis TaxID=263 RepID=A0A6B0KEL1_FRATU|nr:sel1 repeat family protein [Francisella tularensis]NCI26525.1 sel1 repeat family protein [Francisella tularensis subsp. holarctica]AZP08084.1 sel1 repeat family protein [Francisella tularensis]AZP09482.1 sel1 repeat family protein [Francisella tularensis]MBF6994005.1 sel1 repeat family protein [Francisella tularensis]
MMSEQENIPKQPKKIGPITITKKNIIKALVSVGVIGSCVFGINSYLSYRHQLFLESYNTALADIQNQNKSGYKNAFVILKELVEDDQATAKDYFYLGYIYQYGLGTEKNYYDAYKNYKKAANGNYPKAFYQIATLYRDGLGVNKSSEKAIEYFKKSYDLGYKDSVTALADLVNSNNHMISVVEPEILYDIYLGYKNGSIIATNNSLMANKYLTTAAAEGYEPAIIVQARDFTQAGDNYRALMLWQTLLYSSDPKVSELAKKEIIDVEKHVKQQRLKELEEQRQQQIKIQMQQRQKLIEQAKKLDQIEQKKEVGLSTPKQNFNNLNGLIYINLFKANKGQLQQFYKDILGVEVDTNFIKTGDNLDNSYIDDFLILAKLKNNQSSLKFDFANSANNNKFEGIIYYYYNNKDKISQDLLAKIIKNNKPKTSSLLPKIYDELETPAKQLEVNQQDNLSKQQQNKKQSKAEKIQLTHEEKIHRMQVFAQKGDFRQFYKLEQAAKDGDVYAIYYTGEYYYNNKEYKEALKYFNEAADKGYGQAYYKLASLYYNEEQNGVPYNKEKAMYYYKKAAELGVRNAQHILMLIE